MACACLVRLPSSLAHAGYSTCACLVYPPSSLAHAGCSTCACLVRPPSSLAHAGCSTCACLVRPPSSLAHTGCSTCACLVRPPSSLAHAGYSTCACLVRPPSSLAHAGYITCALLGNHVLGGTLVSVGGSSSSSSTSTSTSRRACRCFEGAAVRPWDRVAHTPVVLPLVTGDHANAHSWTHVHTRMCLPASGGAGTHKASAPRSQAFCCASLRPRIGEGTCTHPDCKG